MLPASAIPVPTSGFVTSTTTRLSSCKDGKAVITTSPNPQLEQKDGSPYYVVITVTNGGGSYITTVLLGNSYPTTFSKVDLGGGNRMSSPKLRSSFL